MKPSLAIALTLACAALLVTTRGSGQEVRPAPGPGTGIVTVTGAVDIRQMPPVRAVQEGPWQVRLQNAQVSVSAPAFLEPGQRYEITWPAGERETVVVREVGAAGWVRVDAQTAARWVNLAAARSLDALR